jgi:hypothetical protein
MEHLMTEPDQLHPEQEPLDALDADLLRLEQEPLDASDADLLEQIAALYDELDPCPDDLADWVSTVLSLEDIDAQMCRLTSDLSTLTREGEDAATTITFENSELTVMLRLQDLGDGGLRVDGWIAPGDAREVELRLDNIVHTAQADAQGRFSFVRVPHGLAHLVLRPPAGQRPGRPTTVTQRVVL